MFSRMRPKGCNGRLTKYYVYFYYIFPIYGYKNPIKELCGLLIPRRSIQLSHEKKIAKRSFRGTLTFSIQPKFNIFFVKARYVYKHSSEIKYLSIRVEDHFAAFMMDVSFSFFFLWQHNFFLSNTTWILDLVILPHNSRQINKNCYWFGSWKPTYFT